MRLAAYLLLSLLAGDFVLHESWSAAAETLVMRSAAPTALMTMKASNGDTWTCRVTNVTITGVFNPLRQATVTSVTTDAMDCSQTVTVPAPAAGSSAFSKATYVASAAVGVTYITVTRSGTASLNVTWSASGTVVPTTGTLYWAAGDTSAKFIKLTFNQPGVVSLTLPGSSAVLTILQ